MNSTKTDSKSGRRSFEKPKPQLIEEALDDFFEEDRNKKMTGGDSETPVEVNKAPEKPLRKSTGKPVTGAGKKPAERQETQLPDDLTSNRSGKLNLSDLMKNDTHLSEGIVVRNFRIKRGNMLLIKDLVQRASNNGLRVTQDDILNEIISDWRELNA
jgi:hypothetical protein